jgi:RimJ/RimL family protein N-acetyltransferase
MELKTERLKLRELNDQDLPELVKLADNLNVSKYLTQVPHPYSKNDGEWFINKSKEDSKKEPRENYNFAIDFNGKFVGIIGFVRVNEFDGTATLGYWLGEEYWRNGYMYEAAVEMIRFAFEDLKLRRINVDVDTYNIGSNGLIKKLGFEYEGMRKQYHKKKSTGELSDTNVYGMLK